MRGDHLKRGVFVRQLVVAVACLALVAGCAETPGGSSASGADVQKNRGYYLQHRYVGEAMSLGNAAMVSAVAGDGEMARARFVDSTDTLAKGLALHRQYAVDRADTQQVAATVLTLGIGIAGIAASQRAASNATTQADLNRVNSAFSNFIDATGNFGQFLNEQIRLGEIGSSAVSRVDRDRWRSVVVSNHRYVRSIVQIHNRTQNKTCTGFFVDTYMVMTAAHCFRLGDALAAFRDTPQNGKNFMTGEREFLEIDYQFSHGRWDGDVNSTGAFDLAFLLMAKPSSDWLPVSTAPVRPGTKLMAIGYSGDLNRGYFLQIDYGCQANSVRANDHLASDCVIWRGNSGGPILSAGTNPRVVGVNSSGHLRRDRSANDTFAASTRQAVAIYDNILTRDVVRGKATRNPFR
jgi:V8-like Glu-specific endopeptidase